MNRIIIILVLFGQFVFAQNELQDQLSAHVHFLSDDQLEGRATGSDGERMALEYITS